MGTHPRAPFSKAVLKPLIFVNKPNTQWDCNYQVSGPHINSETPWSAQEVANNKIRSAQGPQISSDQDAQARSVGFGQAQGPQTSAGNPSQLKGPLIKLRSLRSVRGTPGGSEVQNQLKMFPWVRSELCFVLQLQPLYPDTHHRQFWGEGQ